MHKFEPTLSNCYLSLCLFLPNYIIEDVSGDWFYDRPPCEGLVKSGQLRVPQWLISLHLYHVCSLKHASLHKKYNGSCKLKC